MDAELRAAVLKVATELEKDLERIDEEAAECLLDIYPGKYVQYVAARLAELGYAKVVRCGECKLQHSPYCYHEGFDDKDYCSEGERVVAKDATGEEGE